MQGIIQRQYGNGHTQANTRGLTCDSRQKGRRVRYRTAIIAEVMLGHPCTVKSELLQLRYLLQYSPVEFIDRAVKLRDIGGQKVRAELHAASARWFVLLREEKKRPHHKAASSAMSMQ